MSTVKRNLWGDGRPAPATFPRGFIDKSTASALLPPRLGQQVQISIPQSLSGSVAQEISSSVPSPDVIEIIGSHLPAEEATVREKLYQLSRALKVEPEWMDSDDTWAKAVAIEWYRRAVLKVPDLTENEAVVTFVSFWNRYDDHPRKLLARIRTGQLRVPKEAESLPQTEFRELAALGFHLQVASGDGLFWLGYRAAAFLFGMNPQSGRHRRVVGDMFKYLIQKGLIRLLTKGTGNRASRYEYVGASIPQKSEVANG